MNFNIVQKKKDDDEEIEEEIEVEENSTHSDNSLAKSNMIKFMGIILGIVIVLFIILFLISSLSPKSYSYTEIEKILKDAAISYFKDYPDSLPKTDGSIVEIDSSNLVQAEKMKDLSSYLDEGVSCTGSVQVEMSGSEYLYTPYLNCGDTYTTVELYKKVVSEDKIVTSGYGLYAKGGVYTFRGEEVDNYVQLGNGLWRIVKVTSNNNIVLISDKGTENNVVWDNRYNEAKLYDAGINQFSVSRIKNYLDRVYKGTDKKLLENEIVLSKSDKSKIVSFDLCIGKRGAQSTSMDNKEECSDVLKNQKLGLLTLSDYLYASLDPNCKTALSKTCKNYNYLAQQRDWWLITADKNDSSMVFDINRSGYAELMDSASASNVRPVIYLNSKVLYKSGNGSLEKPYRVR